MHSAEKASEKIKSGFGAKQNLVSLGFCSPEGFFSWSFCLKGSSAAVLCHCLLERHSAAGQEPTESTDSCNFTTAQPSGTQDSLLQSLLHVPRQEDFFLALSALEVREGAANRKE